MEKKLLAVAVALSFSATVTADIGNVSVYGKANLSYNLDNPAGDDNNDWGIHSNASRLGFWAEAGQEDLSAFVKIEYEVDMPNGTGLVTARNQVAGFKGDWGSVFFGKHDSPLKVLGKTVDLFNDYHEADIKNLSQKGLTKFGEQRDSGTSNYRGTFSGLGVWVQVRQDELNQSDDELPIDDINASVVYRDAGLTLGAAFDANNSSDTTATRWVAGYAEKSVYSVAAMIQTGVSAAKDDSTVSFVVSGSVNLDDANVLKAVVGIVPEDDDAGQVGNSLVTLGWEQKASKNVKVFAYVSQDDADTDSDDDEDVTVGGGFEIKFGKKAKGLY